MGRPSNPDLSVPWRIHVPATLAGTIEHMLFDAVHGRMKHGARNRLVVALIEQWAAQQLGRPDPPSVPSQFELLNSR